MLRASDSSESIPLSWWCVAILVTCLLLWFLQNPSNTNTIVIYTPQLRGCEGPDVDSIHLDIQFRQSIDHGIRDHGVRDHGIRERIVKSQSMPTMYTMNGSKKTM
jgi:hypothetical protein